MALQLKDRIYTNCSTIGKADIEIGATKEGYQGWEAITDGSTVYYCITDDTAWEVGYGVKTGTEIVRNLLSSNTGSLLSLNGNSSVFCTYPAEKAVFLNLDGNIHFPSANVTANTFVGKGSGITNINAETNNLAPEAPTDGETYARNNKTWVSIAGSSGIPDAPVDGVMYGRQDGEWNPVADAGDVYTKTETNTLLDAKADKATTYTKPEVDASQNIQDNAIASNTIAIQANTDAIAALPTPVDTYTKSEIDAQQEAQDNAIDTKANQATTYTKSEVDSSQSAQNSNISSNTTAIGALSGRVSANEQDIATLQDGIFFSSSYKTDYPSSPNRDPETGNIYLQDLSAFTYSYADANQVFISKTDEQGNVRQFTAVKPDDILVLNQVESPNYGRYKVTTVNDLGDYVNVIIEFQVGEGTVLEGDTLALQAFPASEGGDDIWTESGGVAEYNGGVAGTEFYIEQFAGDRANYIKKYADPDNTIEFSSAFGGFKFLTDSTKETLTLARSGEVSTTKDSKNLTLDANVAELGAKARITTDTNSLELKVGSGGLPDMTVNDSEVTVENKGVFKANVDVTGVVTAEKFVSTTDTTTADAPNVHMTAGGSLVRSTASSGGGSPIVIAGEVNKTGAKVKGTGFTSAKIGGTTTNTYKVTFDTEMPNTNYIVLTTAVLDGPVHAFVVTSTRTTSYVNINTHTAAGAQAVPFQFAVINLDDVVVASTLGGVTNRTDDIAKLTEKLNKLELKFKALK